MALYYGKPLPILPVQYKDFTQWKNNTLEKEKLEIQEKYWLKEFETGIPVLNLPVDYPRPQVQSFEGKELKLFISPKETAALDEMAKEQDVTLYMLLLALINLLLSNVSGAQDIVIGTVTAGRQHPDLLNIVGMFANTLPMRNFPRRNLTFVQFLKQVKKRTLQAFQNQDYPFEELVDHVATSRDMSRNPLFDVMFVLQDRGELPALEKSETTSGFEPENRTSKFDIQLTAIPLKDRLLFIVEYCTALFKEETIQRLLNYFKEIIAIVLDDKDIELKEIEISHDLYVTKPEKIQVQFGFE
jgi:non-ribosomal peptide synthetase component F